MSEFGATIAKSNGLQNIHFIQKLLLGQLSANPMTEEDWSDITVNLVLKKHQGKMTVQFGSYKIKSTMQQKESN